MGYIPWVVQVVKKESWRIGTVVGVEPSLRVVVCVESGNSMG